MIDASTLNQTDKSYETNDFFAITITLNISRLSLWNGRLRPACLSVFNRTTLVCDRRHLSFSGQRPPSKAFSVTASDWLVVTTAPMDNNSHSFSLWLPTRYGDPVDPS